ncbi:unnamed protein product [Lupinus luteus]|uniref:GDSL esterase/lipase n=1 Tax=Lupinus luteus TaxID=3873 RepID=A0AAV1W2W5_LUPLU
MIVKRELSKRATALGIKDSVPAYNSPSLGAQDLATGVCFASGGSGADVLTSSFLRVISLADQLQSFKEYIAKLTATVGQEKASSIISNALFITSLGNNDIAITYSEGRRPELFPTYAGQLVATALGIKDSVPAYNSPSLGAQDLATGVCFASGGSGADVLTSSFLRVISLADQLQSFKEYIAKLTATVGQEKASSIISNALFITSLGNNDIAITYSEGRRPELFPTYAGQLVGWTSSFLQEIYALGARHVWVFSTLPLGCLPGGRATSGMLTCNELVNGLATQFNGLLQHGVSSIKATTHDYDVQFVDVYTPLRAIINNPAPLGFTNVMNGCCGGAAVATGQLCTPFTGQCLNPSTFVFWDFAHPTQRSYEIIVATILQQHK